MRVYFVSTLSIGVTFFFSLCVCRRVFVIGVVFYLIGSLGVI